MTDWQILTKTLADRERNYTGQVLPDGTTWVTDHGRMISWWSRRKSIDYWQPALRSWFPVTFVFDSAGNYVRVLGSKLKALWLSRGTGLLAPGFYDGGEL